MANVLINEIYEVRYWAIHLDQAAVFRRHYRVTTAENLSQPQGDLAVHFDSNHVGFIKALLATSATYRGVQVQRIWPLPRTFPSVVTASAGAGTGAVGDPLPRQTSGIITLNTEFAGRAFRGRIYLPFPSEGANDVDGTPTAAYLTSLQAFATDLATTESIADAGANLVVLTPVIYHFLQPGTSHTVTAGVARDKWATQRRRGAYGNPNSSPI